jgi:glycosyltransferase involved in cell wall biosynthesis|tara:strand:- start:3967 stop:5127 length:1161 start_codon:yes stop_codon:yes gene_type:complete
MKNNLKILRIIQTLNPEYGGPANAIIDSSIVLQEKGYKVDILTYDSQDKIKNINKKKIRIINKGPSLGGYNLSIKAFFWLLKNKKKYDIFIIHGIWHFSSLLARILLRNKYYIFLHGGLDTYFKSEPIKLIKKKIYWILAEKKNLLLSKKVLLTTYFEQKQLNNTYVNTKNIPKKYVGYGILKPKINKIHCKEKFYKKFPFLKNKKYLLFLGRFHPKKGCFTLLKAIKLIIDKKIDIKVLMVGPESIYKKKIQIFCKENGLKKNIFWSNTMTGELKWGSILNSEGMVLSSHGENFGISLVEALSCAKPVLTTYKVGIYKDILKYKAGFISKDKPNDFAKILEKFKLLKKNDLKKLSYNSYNCFDKNFNIKKNYYLAKFLKKDFYLK